MANAEQLASDLTNLESTKKRILELIAASSSLNTALKNHLSLDEKELRLAVDRVRHLEWIWASTDGITEGFRIAQQRFQRLPKIEKKVKAARGQWRSLRLIVEILKEDPNRPVSEIFKEMDRRKVPLFSYGGVFPGKGSRKWSDVSSEQVFKNLVSNARKDVRKNIISNKWEKLLRLRTT
jgi:hypothetical protein